MIISAIGILWCCQLRAQPGMTISGSIQDISGIFLAGATVQIWTAMDTLKTISGEKGQFFFPISTIRDSWDMLITMQGFQPFRTHFRIAENTSQFILPPIKLLTMYKVLETVTIHRSRPSIVVGDTVVYRADAYTLREGAVLEDLMKNLPGIRVDPDSGLVAMGKKVRKVMLDGKIYAGDNIQAVLKNLSYDMIDKVEIIDDYGDQARLTGIRVEDPQKLLNITLKDDKRHGLSGNAQGGGGNLGQYISNLFVNYFSGDTKFAVTASANNNSSFGNEYIKSADLNYADRWGSSWTGSGDAGYLTNKHLLQTTTFQKSNYNGDSLDQQQTATNMVFSKTVNFNYQWLYEPTQNKHLRIEAMYYNQNNKETDQLGQTTNESDSGINKTTLSQSNNKQATRNTVAETKIYYGQASPKTGHRFSFDADLRNVLSKQSGDNLTSSRLLSDSLSINTVQHYRSNDNNTTWDISSGLHYFIPTGAGGFLECGYSIHQAFNHTDRNWQQPDNSGTAWQVVDSLSNSYDFRSTVHDIHTGYNHHGDIMDLEVKLIAEPGSLVGESAGKFARQLYHYFNLFPSASVNYTLSKTQKLHFDYITIVTAPTLQQVQPVTDLSNPQYPVTGNPSLKPAIVQSASLTYEYNMLKGTDYQGYGLGLSYTTNRDQIIPDFVHPLNNNTVLQQTYFVNASGSYVLNLPWHFDLPFMIHKRFRISGWGLINKNHSISMADYTLYPADAFTLKQYLTLLFRIPDKTEINLSIGYDHTTTKYRNPADPPLAASYLTWRLEEHQTLFRNWDFTYLLIQGFSSGITPALVAQPLRIYATLQHSFGKKRQFVASVAGSNLTNAKTGIDQASIPGTITQTQTNLVGRVVMLSLRWQFEHFVKNKPIR